MLFRIAVHLVVVSWEALKLPNRCTATVLLGQFSMPSLFLLRLVIIINLMRLWGGVNASLTQKPRLTITQEPLINRLLHNYYSRMQVYIYVGLYSFSCRSMLS